MTWSSCWPTATLSWRFTSTSIFSAFDQIRCQKRSFQRNENLLSCFASCQVNFRGPPPVGVPVSTQCTSPLWRGQVDPHEEQLLTKLVEEGGERGTLWAVSSFAVPLSPIAWASLSNTSATPWPVFAVKGTKVSPCQTRAGDPLLAMVDT